MHKFSDKVPEPTLRRLPWYLSKCGVGYTLQIIGQKGTDPTVASLILSLESVVSVLAGWLLLGQRLSVRELGGCALMFAAILLAQLPERRQS